MRFFNVVLLNPFIMEEKELYINAETGVIVEFLDIGIMYDTLLEDDVLAAYYIFIEDEDELGIIENDIYCLPLDIFCTNFRLIEFPNFKTCIEFCDSMR